MSWMVVIEAVLLGLAAGFVGTMVLTLSERTEMALTGREPSMVPGQVGARLMGRDDEPGLERRSTIVHWLHGVASGSIRGLLSLTGLGAVSASILFFVLVWSSDALVYRLLGIADVPWRWEGSALATDLFHKGVYAVATSAAFVVLQSAL